MPFCLLANQRPGSPSNPFVAAALRQVEQGGLASEESRIDPCLLCRRRMAPKDWVWLPAATIEQSARAGRIGHVGSGQQRDAGDKHSTIEVVLLDCRLRLWCVWKVLGVQWNGDKHHNH